MAFADGWGRSVRLAASAGIAAAALTPSVAAPLDLRPTAAEIQEARSADPGYDSFMDDDRARWEADLRARLAHDTPAAAAAALAVRYQVEPVAMRRLVELWIVARARQYRLDKDSGWKGPARAELRALAPALRRSPLGVGILAQTLDAIDECRAEDFDALIAGAPDRADAAYRVAAAAACEANWARAVLASPDRPMAVLVRMAHYGGMSLGDAIVAYGWMTTPAALARVREGDRAVVASLLWQRYLTGLFKAGMGSRALALLDAMTPDLRAAVLSPRGLAARPVVIDGITLSLGSDARRSPPPAVVPTEAPIYQVAQALAEAGRQSEAKALLATLPGLVEARTAAACAYDATGAKPGCPKQPDLDSPTGALVLDHLLNDPEGDPYPIAEAVLAGNSSVSASPSAAIICRVYLTATYPGLCTDARRGGSGSLDEQMTLGEPSDTRALEDRALAAAVPGFAAARAAITREAPPPPARPAFRRETVAAEAPPFPERPIAAANRTPAAVAGANGMAPLPPGFDLVRAERQGDRAIAISVSQALDPTGEVSRGGYWVHLSSDGGRHWAAPAYTGLADRFPYVVEERSSAPLLAGDMVQLAVRVAEIDTASITYPPVALQTRRRAEGLFLAIPLAALTADRDGDGITDLAAHHLLLDRPAPERPFRVGTDGTGTCGPAAPTTLARVALLQRLIDPSGRALVEPVDRPGATILAATARATAPAPGMLFLQGDPADYACLRAARPILVFRPDQIAATTRMTPDFHAFELPPIVWNRAHDRGFARWSTGWAGGTYRLRLVGGRWVFDSISSWMT